MNYIHSFQKIILFFASALFTLASFFILSTTASAQAWVQDGSGNWVQPQQTWQQPAAPEKVEWVQDANGQWVEKAIPASQGQWQQPAPQQEKWVQDANGTWVKQSAPATQQGQWQQPATPQQEAWVQDANGTWVKTSTPATQNQWQQPEQKQEWTQPEPKQWDNNDDPDGDGIKGWNDKCPNEKENFNDIRDIDGCPDSVEILLRFTVQDLQDFWRAEFQKYSLDYTGPSQVRFSQSRRAVAYYNQLTDEIVMGLDFTELIIDEIGDTAPVVALAHEWGHLIQDRTGLFEKDYRTIDYEKQADCFAGAYIKDLKQRGLINEEDVTEGATLMFAVGDNLPDDHPQAHGKGTDRMAIYMKGYEEGSKTCFDMLE